MTDLEVAKEVFLSKAEALTRLATQLDSSFTDAINLIMGLKSHLVISGVGKSGLVGQKMSATLSSTGTPSFFMHPTEAYHGDLGMITDGCGVVLISNSGETEEVLKLLPWLTNHNIPTISITGNPESTLAKKADVSLIVKIEKEICPNNLAPTTSTTATIALGDAIAVALMTRRDFGPSDFAKYHPGGSLGKKLYARVGHYMKKDGLPLVHQDTYLSEALIRMANGRVGLAVVCDESMILKGVITDGDVRRILTETPAQSVLSLKVGQVMSKDPYFVRENDTLILAESILKEKKVKTLIVIVDSEEGKKVVGILDSFDL